MSFRAFIKTLISLPVFGLYALYRLRLIAFLTISRMLAVVPGVVGVIWRRSWYERALAGCGEDLYVDWMAAIRTRLSISIASHIANATGEFLLCAFY